MLFFLFFFFTRLLLLNSEGAFFAAEHIYTRHLKFGIKYSVNGIKAFFFFNLPRTRLRAKWSHRVDEINWEGWSHWRGPIVTTWLVFLRLHGESGHPSGREEMPVWVRCIAIGCKCCFFFSFCKRVISTSGTKHFIGKKNKKKNQNKNGGVWKTEPTLGRRAERGAAERPLWKDKLERKERGRRHRQDGGGVWWRAREAGGEGHWMTLRGIWK